MTKSELIANIKRDRDAIEAVLARVGDARMTQPALEDGWSVKDIVAHITSWEQLCLIWVRTGHRGEGPFTPETLNALNAKMHAERANQPLPDVLAEATCSHAELLEMAEAQTGEALAAPPSWGQANLAQIISSNSDEHYREHAEQIARWLKATPQGRP
ncbi:MAG: ClbS/DfsB family four-helix bundle protein [Dehalococcoidia bacterium]